MAAWLPGSSLWLGTNQGSEQGAYVRPALRRVLCSKVRRGICEASRVGFVTGRGKVYSGGISEIEVRGIFVHTKINSFREILKHIQFVGPDFLFPTWLDLLLPAQTAIIFILVRG